MKKIYNKPETTTVLLLSTNAIMAVSPPTTMLNLYDGTGTGTGTPGNPE